MTRLWNWFVGGDSWNYVREIQAWKSETPLRLPPIRPLKAKKAKKKTRREMGKELFFKKRGA